MLLLTADFFQSEILRPKIDKIDAHKSGETQPSLSYNNKECLVTYLQTLNISIVSY